MKVRGKKFVKGILLSACVGVFAAGTASAAPQTWTGGGGNDNWSTGLNWLSGTAPVADDILTFDGAVRPTPVNDYAAGTLFDGLSFAAGASAFTLSGNQITLHGDIGDDTPFVTQTINLGLALDAARSIRVTDAGILNIGGVISGGFGITKTGNGILQISGNNTYTGNTVLDGGTLAYMTDNSGVKALNFGITPTATAASTTPGTLDVSANVTTTGLNAQTNSSTANIITVGTGKTLTVNGVFAVGVNEVYSNPTSAVQSHLRITGDSVVVNAGANNLSVNLGRSNTPTNTDPQATLDMSGLANFTFTSTGEFRVGAGNGRATALLANTSNAITSNQVRVGDSNAGGSGNNNGGRSTMRLGGGTNIFNTNNFIVGEGKSGGTVDFQSASGSIAIAGATGGTSLANITLGSSVSGTGSGDETQFLVAGHDANIQSNNVILGRFAGATGGNSARANVTFDTGTWSANSIQMGVNSSGTPTPPNELTNPARGIFTMGGPTPDSASTAVLNVANTFYLANRTHPLIVAGPSEGRFIINGGTANINTDILDASTTVSKAGPNVTTLTLNGGTLNLSGHNIGTTASPITTINLTSGNLNNPGRIAGRAINIWNGFGPAMNITGAPTYIVAEGGLLNSTLPVLNLASGGGLEGGGASSSSGVIGDVSAAGGSHISMGTATSAGTLNFYNSLSLNDTSTVKFKLSDNAGFGNDQISVGQNFTLGGLITLDISALGLGPQNGNVYNLFTYGGTLTGNQSNFKIVAPLSRATFSIVPTATTPGVVQLSVTGGGSLALTWRGDVDSNWDFNTTANWRDPSNAAQKFLTSDQVIFDDSSTNLNDVQVVGTLLPGSVTVNATRSYKLAGAGSIGGATSLNKQNTGTLVLANANTYGGTTDINGGVLQIGDGGTTGTTGTGNININTGSLAFNRSNAFAMTNVINGIGNVVQNGAGVVTLSGANGYSGGTLINTGAVKVTTVTGAGTGAITVNSAGTLVTGANIANPITVNGGVVGASAASILTGDVTLNGATATFRMGDPTNLPTATADSIEISIGNNTATGNLQGSANMNVLSNGQDNNPDSGSGFRLRGTGVSNYSGTITVGNNVKFELQTSQAGPFTPAGTGKIVMTAGDATLGTALTTVTKTGGYSELNIRNNLPVATDPGDTIFGTDVSVVGSGLVILNPLGTAKAGSKITMGKLTTGANQEVGLYLSANPAHVLEFTSVSLNGTTTFSPKTPGFGLDSSVGSDLSLANISETTPGSGVIMSGLRTLFLPTANTYTGPTQINSGIVKVTNTSGSATGSGAVNVASGATLTGSGIIGGNVTARTGSHIVPGDAAAPATAIGTITLGGLALEATSNLDFEGNGSSFDLINVTSPNGLTFSGNASLNLAEVGAFSAGDYTLIDYAGSPIGDLTGKLTLSTATFGGGLNASLVDDAANTRIRLHLATAVAGPAQWAVDDNGSWTTGSNWNTGTVPDGAANGASFLGVILADRTVTLDGSRTIGSLAFDNEHKYTIAAGTGGTLTIGDETNDGTISVATGSHVISVPVAVASSGTGIDVDSGAALHMSGGLSIAAGKSLSKSGAGTLRVSGPQAHGAGATLTQTGGTLQLDTNAGSADSAAGSNLVLRITGNAASESGKVVLNADQDLKELNILYQDDGTQTLDLNTGPNPGDFRSVRVYADVLTQAKVLLANAIRNGNGPGNTQDGIIDSGLRPSNGIGIALIDDHVLIRPTRIGDLNLDGTVTIADFIALASHFNQPGTWQEGDVNYDGSITIADFIALASNFNQSYTGSVNAIGSDDRQLLASFASSIGADPSVIGSAVPEPGTMGLLVVGALGLMARRRRRISIV